MRFFGNVLTLKFYHNKINYFDFSIDGETGSKSKGKKLVRLMQFGELFLGILNFSFYNDAEPNNTHENIKTTSETTTIKFFWENESVERIQHNSHRRAFVFREYVCDAADEECMNRTLMKAAFNVISLTIITCKEIKNSANSLFFAYNLWWSAICTNSCGK